MREDEKKVLVYAVLWGTGQTRHFHGLPYKDPYDKKLVKTRTFGRTRDELRRDLSRLELQPLRDQGFRAKLRRLGSYSLEEVEDVPWSRDIDKHGGEA